MAALAFDIPVGDGRAHAKLYCAGVDCYGLTLHDGTGRPIGHGRTLSFRQARELAAAVAASDGRRNAMAWRTSLVWAALGYERKSRRPVASGMCHPGAIRLHGKA